MLKNLVMNLPNLSGINALPSNEAIVKSAFTVTKELLDLNAKYARKTLANSIDFANMLTQNYESLYQTEANAKTNNNFVGPLIKTAKTNLYHTVKANTQLTQAAAEDYRAWLNKSVKTTAAEYQAWFKGAGEAITNAA